jgi:FdhD protein
MKTGLSILRIRNGVREKGTDFVAAEIPLKVVLDGKELCLLSCSPSDIEDLVWGFLKTSRLIDRPDQIKTLKVDRRKGKVSVERVLARSVDNPDSMPDPIMIPANRIPAEDVAGVRRTVRNQPDLRLTISRIRRIMAEFRQKAEVYLETGGTHSAALSDGNDIIIFREDIGRCNAVDKVIGGCLKKGGAFGSTALITSGRMTSELVFKAADCGIPLVLSFGAPTDRAVKLARALNVTLVGFIRRRRANVYSGEARILRGREESP